ncbi:hypothetical protein ACC730_38670, partial [Rhizobium ruizarguesonis]
RPVEVGPVIGTRLFDHRKIIFALAASLFAVSIAGDAFAQPTYSDDYTNDSDGLAPSPTSKPAPVHYSSRKASAYSG